MLQQLRYGRGARQPQAQGGRLRVPRSRRARPCRRSPSSCARATLRTAPGERYRYEREVEEFLRWSPPCAATTGSGSAAVARSAGRAGARPGRAARSTVQPVARLQSFPPPGLLPSCAPHAYPRVRHRRRGRSLAPRAAREPCTRTTAPTRSEIGKGVRVGGVDICGLRPTRRARSCATAVLEPLSRPVVVAHAGERYKLRPARREGGGRHRRVGRRRAGALARREHARAHVARAARRVAGRRRRPRRQLLQAGGRAGSSTASAQAVDEPAATRRSSSRRATSTPREAEHGRRLRARQLERQVERALPDTGADQTVARRARRSSSRRSRPSELAEKYPAIVFVDRGGFQLSLFKNLKLAKRTGSRSARSAWRRRRGSTTSRTRRSTPPGACPNSAWAGSLAGQVIPGGTPAEPAQGALAGHLRRRRHPRHRRAARSAPTPRTAASGC